MSTKTTIIKLEDIHAVCEEIRARGKFPKFVTSEKGARLIIVLYESDVEP